MVMSTLRASDTLPVAIVKGSSRGIVNGSAVIDSMMVCCIAYTPFRRDKRLQHNSNIGKERPQERAFFRFHRQGGGKPGPYPIRTCRATRRRVGAGLAPALVPDN